MSNITKYDAVLKASLSDPEVGGTFLTFLLSFMNISITWTDSISLWLVAMITKEVCVQTPDSVAPTLFLNNTKHFEEKNCNGPTEVEECENGGGDCFTLTNGYYYVCVGSFIIGALWFIWAWRTVQQLQKVKLSKWRLVKNGEEVSEDVDEEETKFKYFYCF